MSRQTVLLTGATGFLGSHLLEALIQHGYNVVVLKRSTSSLLRIANLAGKYKSYDVDSQSLKLVFEDQYIDCVIHTACHYGRNSDPISQIVESNVLFGMRIIEACIEYKTRTFFNTDTLLQKHLNIYTLSKKQFVELLVQQVDKIQIVNLKLEHMYGPKDDTAKLVPWVVSKLSRNVDEIKLTKGDQKRDFIYIDDVVSAFLIVLKKAPSLSRFNEFDVGTGRLVTVKCFLEQLKEIYQDNFGPIDTKLAFGAIPYREGEMMTVDLNNKGLVDLGWSPNTNLKEGLTKILKDTL